MVRVGGNIGSIQQETRDILHGDAEQQAAMALANPSANVYPILDDLGLTSPKGRDLSLPMCAWLSAAWFERVDVVVQVMTVAAGRIARLSPRRRQGHVQSIQAHNIVHDRS
jgi:hypothetical protein